MVNVLVHGPKGHSPCWVVDHPGQRGIRAERGLSVWTGNHMYWDDDGGTTWPYQREL